MNTGNARVTLLLAAVLLGAAGCAPGGGTTAPASASATEGMQMGSGASGGPPGSSATATSTATSSTATITVRDFAYGTPLVVAAGAQVTVTNMDSAEHTVTADDGSAFDVDVKGSGGTATFTAPSKPGTYAYHCTFHPGMHGTLTVK
ncbi:cupredoxin domain-containing protein [Arthrobacter sp. C9C5]|uniref:cupredoxin domain-containing protein n=1 Tax=Arthrobacter sp. C9C5 TaxID=2735267 RepID=UPI001C2F4E50|nr:cupredoxin domain-containing protein [Arthrobacter sp. C9C5]